MYHYRKFIDDNMVTEGPGWKHFTGFLKQIGACTIRDNEIWVEKERTPYKPKHSRGKMVSTQIFVFEFVVDGVTFIRTIEDWLYDRETVRIACDIAAEITRELQKYKVGVSE